MRRHVLLAAAAAALLLAGCKGPCRQLAEKLCDCEPNTIEKENCLQKVQAAEEANTPTAQDDLACEARLEQCQCADLESEDSEVRAAAKKACGLARE